MADLVSVVIPVFNQAPFVRRTVESVVEQTYREIEIIVVDDGSTDESVSIVESIRDPRLRLIRQGNKGPSAALNAGLRAASAPLIAILGGDDVAYPNRIERQVAVLEGQEVDSLYCRPDLIDEEGRPLPDHRIAGFFEASGDVEPPVSLRKLFAEGNYFCAPTQLMRRAVVERIGYFHEGLVQAQDYDYCARMAGAGLRILIADERLIAYRRHRENLSGPQRSLATDRELTYVALAMVRQSRPGIVRAAFADVLDPPTDPDRPLSVDELGLILLSHPRSAVRERAFDLFVDARRHASEKRGSTVLNFAEFYGAMNDPA